MSWDDVRIFLAIAQAHSLSGAAKELGMDHSTLSRRLAALERAVGGPLFLRSAQGMRPTPRGTDLLASARIVGTAMDSFNRASTSAAAEATSASATVRISTSQLALTFLAPHILELSEYCAHIAITWAVSRELADLSRGDADIILGCSSPAYRKAPPSAITSRLAGVDWRLYAKRGGRVPEGHVIRYSNASFESADAWLDDQMPNAVTAARVEDVLTAMALIEEGVGAAILPCFLGDARPTLVSASDVVDEYVLYSAVHPDLRDAPPVRAVLGHLRGALQATTPHR